MITPAIGVQETISKAEWERVKKDLQGIINDPKSDETHVRSAFHCLCRIAEHERSRLSLFPVMDALEQHHPMVALSILPMLPERFRSKDLSLIKICN